MHPFYSNVVVRSATTDYSDSSDWLKNIRQIEKDGTAAGMIHTFAFLLLNPDNFMKLEPLSIFTYQLT